MEPTILDTLGNLVRDLAQLLGLLLAVAGYYTLILIWIVWWLLGVNWRRCWQALADGAWAPVVLLMLISALVWSRLQPVPCDCLGFVTVPNFWWQLGEVSLLVAIALFCGWLQGVFHWAPAELDLDPPVHGFEHVHDHSLDVPPQSVPPEPHH
jgi:hypothetical protein